MGNFITVIGMQELCKGLYQKKTFLYSKIFLSQHLRVKKKTFLPFLLFLKRSAWTLIYIFNHVHSNGEIYARFGHGGKHLRTGIFFIICYDLDPQPGK